MGLNGRIVGLFLFFFLSLIRKNSLVHQNVMTNQQSLNEAIRGSRAPVIGIRCSDQTGVRPPTWVRWGTKMQGNDKATQNVCVDSWAPTTLCQPAIEVCWIPHYDYPPKESVPWSHEQIISHVDEVPWCMTIKSHHINDVLWNELTLFRRHHRSTNTGVTFNTLITPRPRSTPHY